MPYEALVREGAAQRDRIIAEVMNALFARLPNNCNRYSDFRLSDGTRCWIKRFSPPDFRDGEYSYGVDVKFSDGHPLAHLEFLVKCSGWERVLTAPIPNDSTSADH